MVTDVSGRRLRDPGVGAWLRLVAPRRARGAMGLVLASDAAMRRLNRRFAGVDRATDVLSFAANEGPDRVAGPAARQGQTVGGAPGSRRSYLGDVVIATGVSRRQARKAGHTWRTELRTLALHGLLHLLGYDHSRDRGEMARVERRLRRKGGLPESLTERAHGRRAGGARCATTSRPPGGSRR
jgi:probable rRNA maturation factor